ncbi:MAG: hypothetical protein KGI70_00160 [Patescibacteria group bacterium]|nr:hypothetical protein [Patescibacteria group bacterium]
MTKGTPRTPSAFVKHAQDVAGYYGFKPLRDLPEGRRFSAPTFASALQVGVRASAGVPLLYYYASTNPSHTPAGSVARDVGEVGLQVVGSEESVGEVMLMKVLWTMLGEWGATPVRVRLNALGDKDSRARFERELTAYLRRKAEHLDEACRNSLSHNPLRAYTCTSQACRTIVETGPRPVNFLTEKSRVHFRTVLEHLEHLGLPYELDDLLASDERDPRILFALDTEVEDATVVGTLGGRFDEFARRSTGRQIPAVGASVFFRKKGLSSSGLPSARAVRAKLYFVQLGLPAKLRALSVLEDLRRAHIPVLHSFNPAHLGDQLREATVAGVSHLIIMGQREVLDGTVIVRQIKNSSQDIVPLLQLPKFLKTLK